VGLWWCGRAVGDATPPIPLNIAKNRGRMDNPRVFNGLEIAAAESQLGPKNRWKAHTFTGP
jgi:hypothetical protein